jgi:hypothetical protein
MGSGKVVMVKRKSVTPPGTEPHFYYQVREDFIVITEATTVYVRKRIQ